MEKSTDEILELIGEVDIKLKTKNEKHSDGNHSMEDLKQKIINYLYSLDYFDTNEIELVKILFETKKD